MIKIVSIAPLVLLSACATSAAGIAKSDVEMSLTSTKTTQAWATCSAEAMIGNTQLRNDGDHYWILRMNGYGLPASRWDFFPTAEGSKAELRASISINTGDERVKNCA